MSITEIEESPSDDSCHCTFKESHQTGFKEPSLQIRLSFQISVSHLRVRLNSDLR